MVCFAERFAVNHSTPPTTFAHMAFIQSDTFYLRGYECDATGRLSVPALMNLMQESANRNAIDYGIGIADLANQGFGWMLMRFNLRMHHYPHYGQTIRLLTYPTAVEKYFIYRDFRVLANDGTLLADASSTWLVFSTEKRAMVPLPDFIRSVSVPTTTEPLPKLPSKPDFQAISWQPTDEKRVSVGWFSIDQNQHVNNVAYVQWLLESVNETTLQSREIAEIDLVYRTESRWHDALLVQSVQEAANTHLHRIMQETSGKDVLLARSKWRPLAGFQTTNQAPMTTSPTQTLDGVLAGLMRRYSERVPDVRNIIDAMLDMGVIQSPDEIENDHIAFRTMGVPNLGLASFEKIFMHYGYEKRDPFNFAEKKLSAYWYSPPVDQNLPRIFASELRVNELSADAQRIIHKYTDTVTSDPADALDLDDADAVDRFLHQPLWTMPALADYRALLAESEYAAWVIYNRYYLNHFTISVHNLKPGYNTVADFVAFLEGRGFRLNSAGGTVKVSPDGGLRQASTVAQMIDAEFAGGEMFRIAGSYVEFAERRVLPQFGHLTADQIGRQHRREGFETGNADKIFESTFTTQTGK